jgi:hypothetical protein
MRKAVIGAAKLCLLSLSIVLSGSCSVPTMKVPEDHGLSPRVAAVIRSGAFTQIESVDGTRVASPYLDVIVPPGTRTVEIAFGRRLLGNKLLYPIGTATVRLFAEPGRTYAVNTEAVPESSWMGVVVWQFAWIAYVTDKMTGQTVVQSDPLPLKAEYADPFFAQQPPF